MTRPRRDAGRPFFLMCHHKAPHRSFEPDPRHCHLYADGKLPVPETFDDDYANRAAAAGARPQHHGRHLVALAVGRAAGLLFSLPRSPDARRAEPRVGAGPRAGPAPSRSCAPACGAS